MNHRAGTAEWTMSSAFWFWGVFGAGIGFWRTVLGGRGVEIRGCCVCRVTWQSAVKSSEVLRLFDWTLLKSILFIGTILPAGKLLSILLHVGLPSRFFPVSPLEQMARSSTPTPRSASKSLSSRLDHQLQSGSRVIKNCYQAFFRFLFRFHCQRSAFTPLAD